LKRVFAAAALFFLILTICACGQNALPQERDQSTRLPPGFSRELGESSEDPSTRQADASPLQPSAETKKTDDTLAAKTSASSTTARQSVIVTIPEGFTFYQIAQRLEANGVCSAKAFYEAAAQYQVQSFAVAASPQSCYRLEGFLYPDTYEFYQPEEPVAALRRMLNNYKAKSGLPDYNTLILASVIERETRSSEHMAMVSSVYHNRLEKGIRLQADATIAYVEQNIKPSPWISNPEQYAQRYNTYKCAALPVGPICNPSRRAIEAAQNPSQSGYLYYFFGSDNTNHYSATYEAHRAAMAQYGLG
jgi:UPF0755 protein